MGSAGTVLSTARRLRSALIVTIVLLLIAALVIHLEHRRQRSENRVLPLMSQVVGIAPNGDRIAVPAETDPSVVDFYPGTRVLTPESAAVLTRTKATAQDVSRAQALAEAQRAWLAAGDRPGRGGPYAEMVENALLDIHTLLLDNGALVAAWAGPWRYVWPRDAAFAAVALIETGHPADALRILEFLQRQQPADGVFEARYRPDESGVPDDRGKQNDGSGWVLWATLELVDSLPPAQAQKALDTLRPMIEASTRGLLNLTDGPGALPPHSQDYWELPMYRLSLGTAAPIALGLRSATSLQTMLGAPATVRATRQRAQRLEKSITDDFGSQGYPRELGGDVSDASISFLLPPFTAAAPPSVVRAWNKAGNGMIRAAGGLAPGVGWPNDGISWTPPTALYALTAASVGDRAQANHWLTWLRDHRTAFGAIPEKLLSTGAPAYPAPLAWSDALVVMAVARI
ncbi:hypothetical protein GCM10022223_46090 [Kineosporia mesophila]|uniref:Glycoside hydrolase family 15 n=1 Tax=Kineosporia mesophila TaxID=566012 RepID=A0ABP7A2U4_9ACTN|nr:hypothetical protein [Kineosporia mesophila]MCD5349023.1 hypothetical protein [Kineosporia mesophila]